jgi:phage terminase large subunit-like protein
MPAKWLPIHKEIKSLLASHEELMLMGGAGSGKTHFMLNVIFKRAMLMPGSRHICFRKRFEHTKNTLWNSAKEHAELEWPGIFESITLNRSGGTWSMEINGSHILFSGLDDNERIEKHLGSEFATIYLNEVSEISNENDVELIASRLRQKIDGRHLLLLDQNPPAKSHWTYRRYVEDAGKVKGRASFKINPIDVRENLPASYIARLEALPERMRQRFLYGEFTSDIEGALWSWEMIEGTRTGLSGEDGRTVVAIDPATTANKDSDETGLVVACQKGNGWKILEDATLKASPDVWAKVALGLYYKHGADCIVAETNQGGDMIKTIIGQIDPMVRVEEVRATKGKHVRAEPVVALYEQGLIEHAPGLGELEEQMMSWVPNVSPSPDRVDALVWALHNLALSNKPCLSIGWA